MKDLAQDYLEFERPVRVLEEQIRDLKEASLSGDSAVDISKEVKALEKKVGLLVKDIYSNLGQWERVLLARHPKRPQASDYIAGLVKDFRPMAGDRYFSEDESVLGGIGFFEDAPVMAIGINKGRKTKDKIKHNFGMPRPEGYRKAMRLMKLADKFGLPIITFVDTPGAYPGIEAEERGQARAIALNLEEMFEIKSPIVSVIIGEGGSGGALGIAIANKVLMMEYSVYSVISPESCASILWANPKMAESAAKALKLGPQKAKELRVIDEIVCEPAGGAHRDNDKAVKLLGKAISKELAALSKHTRDELYNLKLQKFREMGNSTLQGL